MMLLGWFEAIADLTDGMDEDRFGGVGFDLISEGGDKAIDAAAGDDAIVTPNGIEDFVARQSAPGIFDKEIEQIEFLW